MVLKKATIWNNCFITQSDNKTIIIYVVNEEQPTRTVIKSIAKLGNKLMATLDDGESLIFTIFRELCHDKGRMEKRYQS
ncbi:MAG: hypothetical protein L0F95_08015 [Lactococcus sp.]|nr:hypothetical protein [Lactococcus sp.]MDN5412333.1 hypothetical protein [Lactococcus sp.]MDN5441077.1 hypothetical protein [Lactococcus lactis]MDN5464610.1 hypothetical protein [Lactococcus lactis]